MSNGVLMASSLQTPGKAALPGVVKKDAIRTGTPNSFSSPIKNCVIYNGPRISNI